MPRRRHRGAAPPLEIAPMMPLHIFTSAAMPKLHFRSLSAVYARHRLLIFSEKLHGTIFFMPLPGRFDITHRPSSRIRPGRLNIHTSRRCNADNDARYDGHRYHAPPISSAAVPADAIFFNFYKTLAPTATAADGMLLRASRDSIGVKLASRWNTKFFTRYDGTPRRRYRLKKFCRGERPKRRFLLLRTAPVISQQICCCRCLPTSRVASILGRSMLTYFAL